MKRMGLLLAVALSLIMGVSEARAAYEIREIVTLYPDKGVMAWDVNDNGVVAGSMIGDNNWVQAYVYENGVVTELPRFSGNKAEAYAVNNLGQLTGWCTSSSGNGNNNWHMARWDNSGGNWIASDLGTVSGNWCIGEDINEKGEISGGWYALNEVGLHLPSPAYGLPAGMNNLGGLAGHQGLSGYGINEKGEIAASGRDGNSVGRAAVWLPVAAYGLAAGFTDLNANSGTDDAQSVAINDAGQVAGYRHVSTVRADSFVWANGTFTFLPRLSSWYFMTARDINNSGVVVGSVDLSFGSTRKGFIWAGGSDVSDVQFVAELDAAGWSGCEFYGISNAGHICGHGTNPLGKPGAFVLVPPFKPTGTVCIVR